jgi:hypothetical protein
MHQWSCLLPGGLQNWWANYLTTTWAGSHTVQCLLPLGGPLSNELHPRPAAHAEPSPTTTQTCPEGCRRCAGGITRREDQFHRRRPGGNATSAQGGRSSASRRTKQGHVRGARRRRPDGQGRKPPCNAHVGDSGEVLPCHHACAIYRIVIHVPSQMHRYEIRIHPSCRAMMSGSPYAGGVQYMYM